MLSLEALFCAVDDFCSWFEPRWKPQLLEDHLARRHRPRSLCLSETQTKLNCLSLIGIPKFQSVLHADGLCPVAASFPRTGERFPALLNGCLPALLPLSAYLRHCFGKCNGTSFIDSTSLKVCHNRRIAGHRVFKGLAARGKTSVDWFNVFKLHLVIKEHSRVAQCPAHPR